MYWAANTAQYIHLYMSLYLYVSVFYTRPCHALANRRACGGVTHIHFM